METRRERESCGGAHEGTLRVEGYTEFLKEAGFALWIFAFCERERWWCREQ